MRRLTGIAYALLSAAAAISLSPRVGAQNHGVPEGRYADLPPQATHCDISLPIHIEISPLNQPEVGRLTRFRVDVESALDPDLVRSSWIEYRFPERLRRAADALERREVLNRSGRARQEFGVMIPDESRYEIRARFVVQLANGKTISQTTVRWIDLGEEDPVEGMIGRIVNPDGTGIRVYRGVTVRN